MNPARHAPAPASSSATSARPAGRCPETGGPCLSACAPGWCGAERAAAAVLQGEGGGVAFRAGAAECDGFGPLLPNPKETFDRVFAVIPEG